MGAAANLSYHDLHPPLANFLDDILAGLAKPQKQIPAKYFYDRRGCELFEAICELPEYYLTRTEIAMMRAYAREMATCLGPGCQLIEYGSGNSQKTRLLLESLNPPVFMPVDIAAEQLRHSVSDLAPAFPGMRIAAVCADYTKPLKLPECDNSCAARKAVYFPGSTIGNLTPEETLAFLAGARDVVAPGGAMLVGVDLKKSSRVLNAAYNDSRGVTAEFNLNLLARINRELGADFALAKFSHHAFYSDTQGRIEMHLISRGRQCVTIAGRAFEFREGESIHTENSYKYSVAEFRGLAGQAGFRPERVWTDDHGLFAVHYLAAPLSVPD